MDEEAQRIAESLRKMRELNQDRVRQREREKTIREERPTMGKRSKSEAPSREEERRRRAAADRQEDEERQRREDQEAKERQRAADEYQREERRQKAAADRDQRQRAWNSGEWNPDRAITRFLQACRFFDDAKFSAETLPLTWLDIPWPILRRPTETTAQDIQWATVKEFFQAIQLDAKYSSNYKDVVKTNVRRFHPDRWANRNCLVAVIDDQERHEIEAGE